MYLITLLKGPSLIFVPCVYLRVSAALSGDICTCESTNTHAHTCTHTRTHARAYARTLALRSDGCEGSENRNRQKGATARQRRHVISDERNAVNSRIVAYLVGAARVACLKTKCEFCCTISQVVKSVRSKQRYAAIMRPELGYRISRT